MSSYYSTLLLLYAIRVILTHNMSDILSKFYELSLIFLNPCRPRLCCLPLQEKQQVSGERAIDCGSISKRGREWKPVVDCDVVRISPQNEAMSIDHSGENWGPDTRRIQKQASLSRKNHISILQFIRNFINILVEVTQDFFTVVACERLSLNAFR